MKISKLNKETTITQQCKYTGSWCTPKDHELKLVVAISSNFYLGKTINDSDKYLVKCLQKCLKSKEIWS